MTLIPRYARPGRFQFSRQVEQAPRERGYIVRVSGRREYTWNEAVLPPEHPLYWPREASPAESIEFEQRERTVLSYPRAWVKLIHRDEIESLDDMRRRDELFHSQVMEGMARIEREINAEFENGTLAYHEISEADDFISQAAEAIGREMALSEEQLLRRPSHVTATEYEVRRREMESGMDRFRREYLGVWPSIQNETTPEAKERSKQLLVSHLTDEQKKTFEYEDRFFLTGSKGNEYEIVTSKLYENVYLLKKGKRHTRLCAYFGRDVPIYDSILGQKLLLEADEKAFLKKANKSRVREGSTIDSTIGSQIGEQWARLAYQRSRQQGASSLLRTVTS